MAWFDLWWLLYQNISGLHLFYSREHQELFHIEYRNKTGSGQLYLNNRVRYSVLTCQNIQVTFCHYPEIFQDPLKYKKISLNFHHSKNSKIYFRRAFLEYFRSFHLRDVNDTFLNFGFSCKHASVGSLS